ncbi:hypothetical protein CONCODRAFT_2273 [Conidiobolus coronatus NRRL 28638]|uniref:OB domain-containing protein n=1 Tax=Conidiobolus coronatus (strain ATCC 28846 / CBS 209.66 / NRRL 28638) TaxID=796925 RepID=A0A137PIB4_CONC2|nr:hypothetical protein CONCODRAFT_2273 [Conidiobolus coronatus NRRL 28638]|eukprot:KXN74710.1 hypothetical protein CONCODRAFT_2273 [Conidiobolus coronatus NRRL 28638]
MDDEPPIHYKLFIKEILESEHTDDNCFNLIGSNIYFNSVLLFGTIIDLQNMNNNVTILLDDSTGVIQLRIEESLLKLKKMPQIGDNINCVGKLINSDAGRFVQLNSFDFINSEECFNWEIVNNINLYKNYYFKADSDNNENNINSQKSDKFVAPVSESISNPLLAQSNEKEDDNSAIDDILFLEENSIDNLIINFDLDEYMTQQHTEPLQTTSSINESKSSSINPTQVANTPVAKEEINPDSVQLKQYLNQFIEDGVLLSRIKNDLTLDNIDDLIDKLKTAGKLDIYCGRVYPSY